MNCNTQNQSFTDFFKIGDLTNFSDYTGKRQCRSLFNNVAGLEACNFLKKRLQHTCFPVKFANFLKTPSVGASESYSDGCVISNQCIMYKSVYDP